VSGGALYCGRIGDRIGASRVGQSKYIHQILLFFAISIIFTWLTGGMEAYVSAYDIVSGPYLAMPSLLIPFHDFPDELALVGKMVVAYGDLEFSVLSILGSVLDDPDMAVRTLYRLRSETNRVMVFEALSSKSFHDLGLGDELQTAMAALETCKKIRNQYAHCHWDADSGQLYFVNLEDAAKSKVGDALVKRRLTNRELLEEQVAFFQYTQTYLTFLEYEFDIKAKRLELADFDILKPKGIRAPKLHILIEE
jgi:hypothetical protein